jgi:uncharacterized protein HemX
MSSNDREHEQMTPHRSTDPSAPVIKVVREITVWQMGTAAALVVSFAAAMYYGQQRQGEKLDALTINVDKVLQAQDNTKERVRDLEYEAKTLRERVTKLEGTR